MVKIKQQNIDNYVEEIRVAVVETLVEELIKDSHHEFDDDTGLLRSTIRVEPQGAAIGNKEASYWQYLDNDTRGAGEWLEDTLEKFRGDTQLLFLAKRRAQRAAGIDVDAIRALPLD